jgi:hypothetical protein
MKDNNTVSVGNCETCGHFPTQFIEEKGVTRIIAFNTHERERREELEIIAAALYLGHDDAKQQFEMYKKVYLTPPGPAAPPRHPDHPPRGGGE